jgi:outer membrane lipoprotein
LVGDPQGDLTPDPAFRKQAAVLDGHDTCGRHISVAGPLRSGIVVKSLIMEGCTMKAYPAFGSVRTCLLGVLLAALTGCASYPVSKSLRKQAKPLTVAEVAANPAAHAGTIVIWGGKVIKTVNNTNGGNIYVLALPLTCHEAPERYAVTTGRFIAHSRGFVDPEVFKKGRLITVAGEITGVAKEPLQEVQYVYPVVVTKELHLWYVPGPYYSYYNYPAWYWGWYGPGWSWGWYGPGWGWGWGWGWEGSDWD